jgi:hypothetical protein
MKWLDEYPELAKHITQLSNSTNMSRKDWAEFMDELRLELEKPRCTCADFGTQFSLDYTFGGTK